jgi:hypothetical protein
MIRSVGSMDGINLSMVLETKAHKSIMKKKPVAMPAINRREFLYPKRTPMDALEMLLGPGVKVVANTNIARGTVSIGILNLFPP